MGWRLGGKGASGRNAEFGQRIEEHGVHIWFGFYDNAFDLMQKAYAALKRAPGSPLATWDEAFKPQEFIALTENINNQWRIWPVQTPKKDGVPGAGNEEITLHQIISTLKAWIDQWLDEVHEHLNASSPDRLSFVGEIVHAAELAARFLSNYLPDTLNVQDVTHRDLLAESLASMRVALLSRIEHVLDSDDKLRRLFICIDLAVTSIVGMVIDGVLIQGFDVINDIEFSAWLRKHGANEKYTVKSAPVVGFYDLVFAYDEGDYTRPNIEAGTMLRGILRIAICYHGSLMWKMQAGMGDVVFTPIYQVLRDLGVKFKFFHKIEELIPDGDSIGEIVLTEQVQLTSGTGYDPLVSVKGLDCWPSVPNYAQIDPIQADLLKDNDINLESNWSNWNDVYKAKTGKDLPVKRLRRGVDFDKIVYGLSVASLSQVCKQLLPLSPALQNTADKVKAVATQAYQVWLTQDISQLGWTDMGEGNQEPVLSSFTEPFDTWAPMDQVLEREDWPAGKVPKNISYFCSALPMKDYPAPSDIGFPGRCKDVAKQGALNQLSQQIGALWPKGAGAGHFDWQALLDPAGGAGAARFDSQYWRANVDPSERYVMSVVGSTQYRPRSDGSGFANLYLAGDWIRTGLNAGCVEAAVMSGMQASRAISGYPVVIKGECDL